MKPCEACTIAKARQKNVPKTHNENKNVVEANEQWLHVISTVEAPRGEGITVTTNEVKISRFYTAKNKMIKPMCKRIHKMEKRGQAVKYLLQDNAGENKKL